MIAVTVVLRIGLVVCLVSGVAAADNAKLVAARRAVEQVRYDDARGLLVDALALGASDPDEVREIYLLSAATAVVLGHAELAEQYYRRVLALDPGARLADEASPKLRQPFIAAQAYMAAHGRLSVRAERRPGKLEVRVVADPLGMVAAVATLVAGKPQRAAAISGGSIQLDARRPVDGVLVLDEHGNVLQRLDPPPASADRPRLVDGATGPAADLPIVRRWTTWAIPAAVAGAIGTGFLLDGRAARQQLDEINAASSTHYLADAEKQRARWKADLDVATIAFVAGGALAATAIVMAATQPQAAQTALAPMAVAHGAGIAWTGRF